MWMMDQDSPFPIPWPACAHAEPVLCWKEARKVLLRSSECKVLLAVSCHHEAGKVDFDHLPWRVSGFL